MQALAEAKIQMDPAAARAKVDEYLRSVRDRHNAEDEAILRGYRALAKGRAVIDLPKCIRLGGVFDSGIQLGLPRLAVATSSHKHVWVERYQSGAVQFLPGVRSTWSNHPNGISLRRRKDCYRMPDGTLPSDMHPAPSNAATRHNNPWGGSMRAVVPPVPPALRPAHSLDGYATLFEVENWAPDPDVPRDPALLKHIGGDLYAVVATWELTELERTILQGMR